MGPKEEGGRVPEGEDLGPRDWFCGGGEGSRGDGERIGDIGPQTRSSGGVQS